MAFELQSILRLSVVASLPLVGASVRGDTCVLYTDGHLYTFTGSVWVDNGSAGSGRESVAVSFANGDSVQRVTVADAMVSLASKPWGFVVENLVTEDQDLQLTYAVSLVAVAAGSFTVNVSCTDPDGDDVTGLPLPDVAITYSVG